MELRLGDIIDDHCIKCRRLTNHSVVSIVEDQVAKVRCRSCYHEHHYLNEIAPPSRKDLKKAELAALAKAEGETAGAEEQPAEETVQQEAESSEEAPVAQASPVRTRSRKA